MGERPTCEIQCCDLPHKQKNVHDSSVEVQLVQIYKLLATGYLEGMYVRCDFLKCFTAFTQALALKTKIALQLGSRTPDKKLISPSSATHSGAPLAFRWDSHSKGRRRNTISPLFPNIFYCNNIAFETYASVKAPVMKKWKTFRLAASRLPRVKFSWNCNREDQRRWPQARTPVDCCCYESCRGKMESGNVDLLQVGD